MPDSYAHTANYGTKYGVSTDLSSGASVTRWMTHPSLVTGPVPMPAHSTQTMGPSLGGAIGALGGAALLAPPAPPVSGGIAVGTYGPYAGSALPATFMSSSSATAAAPQRSNTMVHAGIASVAAEGDAHQHSGPHSFGGGSPFFASAASPYDTGHHLSSVGLGSGGEEGGVSSLHEGSYRASEGNLLGEFISSLDARTAVRLEPGASWQQ